MKKLFVLTILLLVTTLSIAKEIDLGKSKGIGQEVIVSLTPTPASKTVAKDVIIKAVFNVELDEKYLKRHKVKLKRISGKKKWVRGKLSYLSDEKTIIFTPKKPLKEGYYKIVFKGLKTLKEHSNSNHKKRKIKKIKYRFYVPKIVPDTIAPMITLNGDSNITLIIGTTYDELGATAVDDKDGNVSVDIAGEVDTSTVGTYKLIYSAVDIAGNSATVSRRVNVTNNVKTLTLLATKTEHIRKLSYYGKDADGKVINYYAGVPVSMQVFATFENEDKEEITDKVEWILSNNAKTPYGSVVLTKDGITTVQASYQNIKSNVIELTLENYETTSKDLIDYTVYDSSVPGRGVDVRIALAREPLKPVTLRLELDPKDKVEFTGYTSSSLPYTKILTFKLGEYKNGEQKVEIEDKDENNTNPYVIKTHILESEDANYGGKDPQDINITPKNEIEFVVPPMAQRRGAIRGVHISMLIKAYATSGVEFRLVDPPEGMSLSDGEYSHILDQEEMATKRPKIIEWDVPMDAIEGETYDITVEVTDDKKRKGSVTFPIKVPKTKPIQIEIVNNELIVTDKDSTLYGMKMKGHSGEDISELKIRSVNYGDVWSKKAIALNSDSEVERIVYIIDNVPSQLDMKFPPYMDNFESERMKEGISIYQYLSSSCILDACWGWKYGDDILYDNTDGTIVPKEYNVLEESKLFMITINEK